MALNGRNNIYVLIDDVELEEIIRQEREQQRQELQQGVQERERQQQELEFLRQELQQIQENVVFGDVNNPQLQNAVFELGDLNQTINVVINNIGTTEIQNTEVFTITHNWDLPIYFPGKGLILTDDGIQEVFTITHNQGDDKINDFKIDMNSNIDATTKAIKLSTIDGINSTAFNKITIEGIVNNNELFKVHLHIKQDNVFYTIYDFMVGTDINYITIAIKINTDLNLQHFGFYAVSNGTRIDIYSMQGANISLEYISGIGSFKLSTLNDKDITTTISKVGYYTIVGRVDVTLQQGYTISSRLCYPNITIQIPQLFLFQYKSVPIEEMDKLWDGYLEEHRHNNPELQHAYDKRFGLIHRR
jgi:hypothetical protein